MLSAYSFGQWQSVGGGVDQQVSSFEITSDSTQLIMGGAFVYTNTDSIRVNSLVAWDGTAWSTAGLGNGNGDTAEFTSASVVNGLALFHDTLFLTSAQTIWHYDPAMGLGAYLVNDQWHPCGSPESWFYVMKANGRLFAGGRADTLYGIYMPGPKEWTGGAWHALPNTPFGTLGTIDDVTYWQGAYYFSGSIAVGDALGVIRWDGVDQWSALGEGVGGLWVSNIVGYGDSLYVGGFFQPGPHVQSQHIQLWDGHVWKPFFPQVEFISQISDLKVHDGILYIAGIYHFTGENTTYGLLRYDGHQLCAIGGSMETDNRRLAFFQGDLYMGLALANPGPVYFQGVGKMPLDSIVPDRCVTVSSVGIAEQELGSGSLQLYPNPTTGTISVYTDLTGFNTIEVLNPLGQVVLRQTLQNGSAVLDGSSLSQGTYVVHALGPHGSTFDRFVKQ